MEMKINPCDMDKQIREPQAIISIMQDMLKRDDFPIDQREHFWIVGLDEYNKLKFIELIALGERDKVNMSTADVYRVALIKNAARLILVHNHPSGNVSPSYEDKRTTLCLDRVAEMVGVVILDHIIISTDDYFSFLNEGLLDEIRLSQEYRILDSAKYEQLKNDFKQVGKVEAIFQEKILIAKKLVELNVDKEIIKKATSMDPDFV